MGRAIGLVECLQASMPDAHITFWHRFYRTEKGIFHNCIVKGNPRIELKEHPWYRETSSRPLTAICAAVRGGISLSFYALHMVLRRIGLPLKSRYQQFDVIIDPNYVEGDQGISAALGAFFNLLNTFLSIISARPVVICAATVMPLRSNVLRVLTKLVLNRVAMITLREELSKEHLQVLGVNKPSTLVTGDLAFLLPPAPAEKLNTILKDENITSLDSPVVGMTPAGESSFVKPEEHIQLMAELADFVVEELNATVIFVPHTSYDAPLIGKIYQQVRNKDKVRAIHNLYMADEVKAIIGRCDIFISPRFHALVAALSLAIPSIGIVAYNQTKFYGIGDRLMGQERYLVDTSKFDDDSLLAELKSRINLLWVNKDSTAAELRERAEIARENTLLNGKLIKELLAETSR